MKSTYLSKKRDAVGGEKERPNLWKKEKRHRRVPLHWGQRIHPRQRKITQHSWASFNAAEGLRTHLLARRKQVQGPQPACSGQRRWFHCSSDGHPPGHRQKHHCFPPEILRWDDQERVEGAPAPVRQGATRCRPKKVWTKEVRRQGRKSAFPEVLQMNITCIELATWQRVVALREDGRALQFSACFVDSCGYLPLRGYGSRWLELLLCSCLLSGLILGKNNSNSFHIPSYYSIQIEFISIPVKLFNTGCFYNQLF